METVRIILYPALYERRWIIDSQQGWVGGPELSFASVDAAREWLRDYPNLVEVSVAMLEP